MGAFCMIGGEGRRAGRSSPRGEVRAVLRLPTRPVIAVLLAGGLTAASFQAAGNATADHSARATEPPAAARGPPPAGVSPYQPLTHRAVPEDRYAMAGGCYAVKSVAAGRYVARGGSSFVADAKAPGEAE